MFLTRIFCKFLCGGPLENQPLGWRVTLLNKLKYEIWNKKLETSILCKFYYTVWWRQISINWLNETLLKLTWRLIHKTGRLKGQIKAKDIFIAIHYSASSRPLSLRGFQVECPFLKPPNRPFCTPMIKNITSIGILII